MTENQIFNEFEKSVKMMFAGAFGPNIEEIKGKTGLDNKGIDFFIGKCISDFSPEYVAENTNGLEMLKLIMLSTYNKDEEKRTEAENMMTDAVDAYVSSKKEPVSQDKVKLLLDLFDVSDNSSLEELINTVLDVRMAIDQATLDSIDACGKQECDKEKRDYDKGGCQETKIEGETRKNESGHECCHGKCGRDRHRNPRKSRNGKNCDGEAKITYSYYDSDTMDKPETVSRKWKFHDDDTAEKLKHLIVDGINRDCLGLL